MGPNSSSKKQKSKEDQDIISNLPDVIIYYILSFLPTRDAVRTCVLSKRWIYLWTFITKLHFNDKERHRYIGKTRFVNSVYRVLIHLNTSSIQSFSLSLSENYNSYHVNQWISVMLRRRLKELYIKSTKENDIFSPSLWKSPSLEKLVLCMSACSIKRKMNYDVRVKVPTCVCLSSLTVLILNGITFTCAPSNDSKKLNLNFPVLRKYETEYCEWLNVKGVTFEVPLLEVLRISHTRVLGPDGSRSVIKFCASRLAKFSYIGNMSDASFIDLSITQIASANILTQREGSDEASGLLAYEFLKKFNNKVECLSFYQPEVLVPAGDSLIELPEFEMLSRLELDEVAGVLLLFLLIKAPLLKTLVFRELLSFEDDLWDARCVPCVLTNLQELYFGRLKGDEHEVRFAKFVVENARVLKRARFIACRGLRWSKFDQFKEKILSLKKSVGSAVIEFS
ncbi:F-box/FBD/LRR-repeat protein At3g14710 isoform X2 [Cajanus cajan]|nr:F-box/FBD/LRR-repeat protein At3g14710 isoform X2 [Cajanus cajan]